MKPICLLRDRLKSKRGARTPCAKCMKRKRRIFKIMASEASVPCEWWTAESDRGDAVVFRCFPKNRHGLTKSARERFSYLRIEYRNALRARQAELGRRYRMAKRRGRFWALIETNSEFGRLLDVENVRYRPAYACEVAKWLTTHVSDMLTMPEHEKLLVELETYL